MCWHFSFLPIYCSHNKKQVQNWDVRETCLRPQEGFLLSQLRFILTCYEESPGTKERHTMTNIFLSDITGPIVGKTRKRSLPPHIVSSRWRTRRHWTLEERHVRQRTAVFQSGDKGISLLLKEIRKWKRRSWSAKGKGPCFVWWHPFRKGPLHRPPFLHHPEAREMSDKEFAQRLRCGSNTVVNSK